MKTSIKLVLIYFLMQILGMLVAAPIGIVYIYITTGTLTEAALQTCVLSLAMLLGFLFMGLYLWRKGYLKNDGRLFSPVSSACLGWSLLAGASVIFLIDFLMSYLTFLPDLLRDTFDLLQSGWLGILCVAVLGPVLEELLFRGAITKVLLRRYDPFKAILFSGLIFGIFHLNPVQVVAASFSGFFFAWLYYKSGSLVPGILIHILNNSLSVWLSLNYRETDTMAQLIGNPLYAVLVAVAALLLLLSLNALRKLKF